VERQLAAKRGLAQEESVGPLGSTLGIAPQRLAREPSPDEALELLEEVQRVMENLLPLHREMLELHLQGLSVEEISRTTQRTEHQVRRVIKKVKEDLQGRLEKV
jgi:DNA-directed RNA polymerase specialized sigma24 family protein